jgi:hypothetical protein
MRLAGRCPLAIMAQKLAKHKENIPLKTPKEMRKSGVNCDKAAGKHF